MLVGYLSYVIAAGSVVNFRSHVSQVEAMYNLRLDFETYLVTDAWTNERTSAETDKSMNK